MLLQSTGLNPATLDGALFTDEAEIIDIWNQCWSALYLCISTIGPIFLAVILIAYLSSKMTASQMIASVGVVFTYVFLLIMVGYTVAIVPFVLISRIFTSLVAPQNGVETEELNTYCRLLTLVVTLLCGVGYFAASSA